MFQLHWGPYQLEEGTHVFWLIRTPAKTEVSHCFCGTIFTEFTNLCEYQNASVKCPFVYLCLSSRGLFIFPVRVSSFYCLLNFLNVRHFRSLCCSLVKTILFLFLFSMLITNSFKGLCQITYKIIIRWSQSYSGHMHFFLFIWYGLILVKLFFNNSLC